jgi:hypothetical protein
LQKIGKNKEKTQKIEKKRPFLIVSGQKKWGSDRRHGKMFDKKGKAAKKEILDLFNEIQINLENNYKDLAIGARKKAEIRLEELKPELKEKDYEKLKATLDGYTKRMEGYHH